MTAFNSIKTNNWPAASNDLEDFLVLKLPLNGQASLTESLPVTAGSTVLHPKRTLTNTGVSMVAAVTSGVDYGATGFTKSTNWRTDYDGPEIGIFNGDGTSTQAAVNGDNEEHWYGFPTPLTNVTKVETRMGHDGNQTARAYMGSGTTSYVSSAEHATYFTVYSGSATTFSKIGWRSNNSSGASVYDIRVTDDTGTYVLTSAVHDKKHYDDNAVFNSSTSLRLDSDPFSYGSNDFTMEFWCLLTGAHDTARHILSAWQDGGNLAFYLGTGGANGYWGSFGVRIGGSQYEANGTSSTGLIPQNTWTHVAGVRHGTNILLFVDGTLVSTTSVGSGTLDSLPDYLYVGKHYSASGYNWIGNLSDLRIYNGVAKYTSNFTPPGAILG